MGIDGLEVAYALESGYELESLADVQWADWDADGRLLVATSCGRLQVREMTPHGPAIVFDENLSLLKPDPAPPPEWARTW